jgi:magnesium transporter
VSETFEALGAAELGRIAELRRSGGYPWIDLSVDEHGRAALREKLAIPEHALAPLLDFSPSTSPSHKFHTDRDHVVFTLSCFLLAEGSDEELRRFRPIEVHVLVHGDYLLTVHRERVSLPRLLPTYTPEGRSEQYVVYAVLDALVGSGFDALNEIELNLEGFQVASADLGRPRVRMEALRLTNAKLSEMRRRIGPQRGIFERISEEIGRVEGLEADSERYFERIYEQLNRLIDAIDAGSDSLAKLIDLRLNETMYRLTVVATIFLPLTFITGFFGMNFGWMVGRIDTAVAFVLLGLGGPALGAALAWLLIQRRGTPVAPDDDAMVRFLKSLRRSRTSPG